MKPKTFVLATMLCLITAGVCYAQNAQIGTWKLNEAKSKIPAGANKNHTVMYEAAGADTKIIVDGTDSTGTATHNEWTGKFDGKDYPVIGDPTSDTRAYRRVGREDTRDDDQERRKGDSYRANHRDTRWQVPHCHNERHRCQRQEVQDCCRIRQAVSESHQVDQTICPPARFRGEGITFSVISRILGRKARSGISLLRTYSFLTHFLLRTSFRTGFPSAASLGATHLFQQIGEVKTE